MSSDAMTRPGSRAGRLLSSSASSDGVGGGSGGLGPASIITTTTTTTTTTATTTTTPDGGSDGRDQTPRKRKRCVAAGEDADGCLDDSRDSAAFESFFQTAIFVKAHPPSMTVKPQVLQPLLILPRAHLALSHLDLSAPTDGLPCIGSNRLIESHIPALDPEHLFRVGVRAPVVLIAWTESNQAVFAMERHQGSLFAACRLGGWVDLDKLRHGAVACSPRLMRAKALANIDTKQRSDESDLETAALHRAQKRKKLVIREFQSLVKQRARSQSVATIGDIVGQQRPESRQGAVWATGNEGESQDVLDEARTTATTPVQSDVPDQAAIAQIAEIAPVSRPDELLENIKTQYLEALYKSMGSLAYFAKGPLSRARALFHLDDEASLEMQDLVDYLKSLVLTTVQIDTKYRETMPEIVTQMKTYVDSSEEGRKARKKQKAKKMRVGKNGLYPIEADLIRTWWVTHRPPLKEDDDGAAPSHVIRSLASLLRTRETQLQMILILEILALEPLCRKKEEDGGLPGEAAHVVTESIATSLLPPPKKRSKHNLPVLLDLHTDRLCIWQTTAFEELALLQNATQGAQNGPDGAPSPVASSEPLRDFCVDIIIPFFSARLPDVCKTVNRKLGGPKMMVPTTDKTRASRALGVARQDSEKHGSATRRSIRSNPVKTARNLERALSMEMISRRSMSHGPPSALDLMRSATATAPIPLIKREGMLPGTKREASDSQLLGMAPRPVDGGIATGPRSANTLSRSASLMTKLDDTRTKRKTASEAELKEAILGIRKPNRHRVGAAIAEAAERRATVGGVPKTMSRGTKSTSTVIEATPANFRFKNVFARSHSQSQHPWIPSVPEEADGVDNNDDDDDLVPPSSGGSCVPGTSVRESYRQAILATPSGARKRSQFGVGLGATTTPRPPSSPPLLLTRAFGAMDPDEFTVPDSTAKRGGENRRPLTHVANQSIFETPTKVRVRDVVDKGKGPTSGNSIYQHLGWDDDDIDELLG